jgi:hypothetical protein
VRIKSLREMLTDLRHEGRLSGDVAHGSHLEERHVSLLRRVQEQLYDLHDWPNLTVTADAAVAAGQRYTGFPNVVNQSAVKEVYARPASGGTWQELVFGIDPEHYNQKDSDAGETDSEPRRWQPYQTLAAEQSSFTLFELWPIPDQDTTVRFRAKRALAPLVDPDTDFSTLDGQVVVLYAAAELLASQKSEDAGLKMQIAKARLDNMRKNANPADNRRVSMVPGATFSRPRGSRFRTGG